uniref:Uncharacterized protein n=1 Tax=Arundo donax TaxID=35708 RepID=A0A0A9ETR5_ARUDO
MQWLLGWLYCHSALFPVVTRVRYRRRLLAARVPSPPRLLAAALGLRRPGASLHRARVLAPPEPAV